MFKIIKNILSLFIVQFSNLILPLALIPYLIRIIGVGNYGELAIIQSIIAVSIVIIDYGFNFTATRTIAINQNRELRYIILINTIFCKMFIFVILFILFLLMASIMDVKIHMVFAILAILTILANVFYIPWFYQGIEKMAYIANISLLSRLISLLPCFFLIKDVGDGYIFILSMMIGAWLSSALSLCGVKSYVKPVKFKINIIAELRSGFGLFLSRVSVSLYTSAIPSIIGYFYGVSAVGVYSAVEKVIRGVASFQGPFIQAIYPYLSRNNDRLKSIYIIYGFPFVGYILFFVFNLIFPQVILGFFDLSLAYENKKLLGVISFLPILLSISGFLGVFILLARGYNKQFSISIIIGSITFVSLIFLLCPTDIIGFYDFPFISLFSEVSVILSMLFFIKKKSYE